MFGSCFKTPAVILVSDSFFHTDYVNEGTGENNINATQPFPIFVSMFNMRLKHMKQRDANRKPTAPESITAEFLFCLCTFSNPDL